MKTLLFINGSMGVGKTAVCKALLEQLTPGIFLDGDWCWNMNPFLVTDETTSMVLGQYHRHPFPVSGLPRVGLCDLRLGDALSGDRPGDFKAPKPK